MDRIVLISILLAIMILAFAMPLVSNNGVESISDIPNWGFNTTIPLDDSLTHCEQDNECAIVSDCCGCNSGGTSIAINNKYKTDWDSYQRQVACTESICFNSESQHISCFSEPICVNEICTLVPNKELVCGSLLSGNCKKHFESDEIREGDGISCREVIEMCKIDQKVLDELNETDWVFVEVALGDLGSDELNIKTQSEILSSLSESEFRVVYTNPRGRWFTGEITKEGIEKLRNNPNILRIKKPIFGGLA